jgi:hypothetical protein
LYGRITSSLILRGEHKLRVCENRDLRRVSRHKREEVARDWRRLQNEELHKLYTSPNVIRVIKTRRIRWAGCSTDGRDEKYIQNFVRET